MVYEIIRRFLVRSACQSFVCGVLCSCYFAWKDITQMNITKINNNITCAVNYDLVKLRDPVGVVTLPFICAAISIPYAVLIITIMAGYFNFVEAPKSTKIKITAFTFAASAIAYNKINKYFKE